MKKNQFNLKSAITLIAALSLFIVSCDKKDEPKPTPKAEAKMINQKDVSDFSKWYYFSFEQDQFIGEGSADPKTKDYKKWAERTDWDIAFHAGNVRSNSGTSGVGKAGIMALETNDFASVKEVTGNDFKVDEIINMPILIATKHGANGEGILMNPSLNPAADSWMFFKHAPEFKWIMKKKNVFIARTADGKKYAKIQFTNFFNDKGEDSFMTMKYAYQKDGGTKFE